MAEAENLQLLLQRRVLNLVPLEDGINGSLNCRLG